MYLGQLLDGFQFHDDLAGDDQIESLLSQRHTQVGHDEDAFPLDLDPCLDQFDGERLLVESFEQPRTERPVDPQGSPDDLLRQGIILRSESGTSHCDHAMYLRAFVIP